MLEKPPTLNIQELVPASGQTSRALEPLVKGINEKYMYWDKVKYMQCPKEFTSKDLWRAAKLERKKVYKCVWPKYNIGFSLTNLMQRQCHDFDMNFAGSWATDSVIPNAKNRYLVGSLIEEAIASSQMEGASTTRKVAKQMLQNGRRPVGKSQQMIYNNYQTIQYIVDRKDDPLSVEMLLEIHRIITEDTLDDSQDAGRFRQHNNVVVENGITHEVVHTPPSFEEIPAFVEDLCSFFNTLNEGESFIHPIIRGIIIHFMIAYIHPFVDGNGRTARALFYWYMLKYGYWLTEYLSISRIIIQSKKSYEKSFLYSENDDNDIGYFITSLVSLKKFNI